MWLLECVGAMCILICMWVADARDVAEDHVWYTSLQGVIVSSMSSGGRSMSTGSGRAGGSHFGG